MNCWTHGLISFEDHLTTRSLKMEEAEWMESLKNLKAKRGICICDEIDGAIVTVLIVRWLHLRSKSLV